MEDFYPRAIYHGIVYFPVIDTSENMKINGKNLYRVLQLNKGKLKEVSTGLDVNELGTDFYLKLNQKNLPQGQILKYLPNKREIKSPLDDKVKQFSITLEPEKILPLSSEEHKIFIEKYSSPNN